LLLDGSPLAQVTLRIGKQKTRSDQNGQFLLKRIPAGLQVLEIEGQTANRAAQVYGRFEVGVEITPKQTTVLPYTIWMPEIETSHPVTIPSPTTSEVVVSTPRIPGLELHLPPGTVIHDHTGKIVTEVTITPIPVEKPPFPMPGRGRVPIYFTIQPGGAHISNATGAHAWLVYPNTDQLPPGTEVEFIYYDPEEAMWETVGPGLVTADGSRIVPDLGVTVEAFTGSTIRIRPIPPEFGPTPCTCCNGGDGGGSGGGGGGGGIDGDPCDLGSGLFLLEKTDLVIPDVLPIVLTRTYRSQDGGARPFGIGMSHEYELYISTKNKLEGAELILPDGGQVHYSWLSNSPLVTDWLLEHTATPTRFYKSRLSVNPTGTAWVLTFRDGMVYELAKQGPPSVLGGSVLRAIRDRHGNTVTIQRNYTADGYGDISRIISPSGHWVAFTYDAAHHITQATDNLGRTFTYTYDVPTVFGRLIRVTDTNGGVTEYTYDPNHRMLTVKDPRGTMVVTNVYNATSGRLIQQTLADGGVYQFVYTNDATGKIIQTDVTDPRGKVRRVTLNAAGYRVSDTRALGQPEQQATTYTWQAGTNLLLSETDPLGRQTTYTYDAKGNITSVTRLAGTAQAVTTTATYEPTFNQVASITDPLNHTTTFAYDSTGNLTTLTDPTNRQVTFTYNGQGQPLTITTPAGTTQATYALGDLTTVTDPLGNVSTQATDGGGRVLRWTNPLGQQTQYAYDALNRVTQLSDPFGQTTAFTYDGNDNLLTLADAKNSVTQYTYDGKNRVATRKDPLLRQESFQYDGKDNLTQTTDRKGQVTTTTYDSRNRPAVVTYTDGATVQYTYDAGNRVTQVVDSVTGTITRGYDGLDRVTSETTPEGTVTYTYDAASRRTSMAVAGQPTVNYSYDNANRLTQVSQGSDTATFAYDVAGRRSSLTLPNGVVVTYSYDAASRLTSLTYTQGAATLGNLTYSYDQVGRRIGSGGSFARTGVPDVINTANYDAANQQLTVGTTGATYDNNGNLATLTDTSGTTTYTWNARDQLVSLSGPSVTASFQYDAVGRRKQKTINGTTTNFLYDGLNVVQELNGTTPSANLLTSLGIDETLLRTDSTGARSFLADGLGSTLALTDAAGLVQGEYTYEPFGKTIATGAASTNAFKYTGREDDGTGLYYYRARYYHPGLQRFISQDPIGFDGGDVNLYAYVGNDPGNWVDPLGLVNCNPWGCDYGDLGGFGGGGAGGGFGGGGRGPGGGSIGGGSGGFGGRGPGGGAKPAQNFKPPTNPPQLPPGTLPPGVRCFREKPTQQYPDGYWKLEKWDGQGWQRLDPRTMKPGSHPDTHVPFPQGYGGPYDN
jgi:RHS repeat-associated protein